MTTAARVERAEFAAGELLAKRATKSRVDLASYRGRIIPFALEVLKAKHLTDAQREHLEAAQDCKRIAAFGANGCGKTYDDAIIAFYAIYVERSLVVATSAKESQLRDQYMRDIARLFHSARTLDGELYTMQLRRPAFPDTGLFCTAASTTDNLRSFHAPRMLIQLQEAQGLPDFAFESAEMMAVGADDRVTLTGNSSQPRGMFHKRCESPAWTAVRFNAEEHPNVVTGTVIVPGAVTRESIAQRAADYGVDSAFYIASVLGLFPQEGAESLIKFEWIERAFRLHESGALADEAAAYCPPGSLDPDNPMSDRRIALGGHSPLIACDPARFGSDSNAVAIVRGPVVEKLIQWRGVDLAETVDRLIALRVQYWTNPYVAPPRFVADGAGLGAGVIDIARRKGVGIYEYIGSSAAGDSRRYLNRRAEDHMRLRSALQDGKIALPRDEQLAEELLALEYIITPKGAAQIIAKDDIKRKIGRSPDKLDAVVMGLSRTAWRSGYGPPVTLIVYT